MAIFLHTNFFKKERFYLMKKYNRIKLLGFMLTLALVIGLLPVMSLTAFAAEVSEDFTTNTGAAQYTGEHFKITVDDPGDDDGFILNSDNSATIASLNGEVITKVEFTKGWYEINSLRSQTGGTVSVAGEVGTVSGVNATSLTVTADDPLQIKAVTVYYEVEDASTESTYTITIPDTLTVQNIGWNELAGGIQASGTLEDGKKLVITASSDNNFNFVKSGDNTAQIPYVFTSKNAGNGKSYSDVKDSGVTSWTFETLTAEGTSHDVGIVIDDYSTKSAGTYNETVTFTANVEDAPIPKTVTVGNLTFTYNDGDTWQTMVDSGLYGIVVDDNSIRRMGTDSYICHDRAVSSCRVSPTDRVGQYSVYLWW